MTKRIALLATIGAALLAVPRPAQASIILTVGAANGAPGDILDLSFSLGSDPTLNLSVTLAVLFNETNPAMGIFIDEISAIGGPTNGVLFAGTPVWTGTLGTYAIDGGAAWGDSDSGTIRVLYDLFSDDPNTCSACYVSSGFADAAFTVTAQTNAVPEPSYTVLLGLCACVSTVVRRRRKPAPGNSQYAAHGCPSD